MKQMQIFEPAMCCATGLCGVGVDPELLRVAAVLNTLQKHKIKVDRFNLSGSPMEFVNNQTVRAFLDKNGPEGLPVVLVDGKLVISGRYPTNAEFVKLLSLPDGLLDVKNIAQNVKLKPKKSGGCGCEGGCC